MLLAVWPAHGGRARLYEDYADDGPYAPHRRRYPGGAGADPLDASDVAAAAVSGAHRPHSPYSWPAADDLWHARALPAPLQDRRDEDNYYLQWRNVYTPDGYPGRPRSEPRAGARWGLRQPDDEDDDDDDHRGDPRGRGRWLRVGQSADDAVGGWGRRQRGGSRWDGRRRDQEKADRRLDVVQIDPVETDGRRGPPLQEEAPADSAKPINVHVYLQLDSKAGGQATAVSLVRPPQVSVNRVPPTTKPPASEAPLRGGATGGAVSGASGGAAGGADDTAHVKHIVINNYYHQLGNEARALVRDTSVGPLMYAPVADELATASPEPALSDDEPVQQPQSLQQQPAVERDAENAVMFDVSGLAHTNATSNSTAPPFAPPAGAGVTPESVVEPLPASDLETYLGSDLHDADDTRPSPAHAGHAGHGHSRAGPAHAPLHPDRRRRRPPEHHPAGGRAVVQGRALNQPPPGRKRCFSIVMENKVKRYKETPC
ncbi:hypothetical protein ONE63_005284 [Megalurothrips usitatus]|uniref:Uncharacterized protein n=1 Tax=Megalurothrips usitatus TaxID=439358 RepID=A0AAV7Y1T5_9NEOP|nr:hypothetical protein ONE63_005284 [Megalurothrips usitatus]